MKFIPFTCAAVFSAALCHAAPIDDVAAAAQKFSDTANFTWTRTETVARASSPSSTRVVNGVTSKDGFTIYKARVKGVVTEERVYYNERYVMLRPDGTWKTPEEMSEKYFGGRNGVTVQSTNSAKGETTIMMSDSGAVAAANAAVASAAAFPIRTYYEVRDVVELLAQVKDLRRVDGVLVGELPFDGIAQRLRITGRDGQPAALSRDASGVVRFWLQDGLIVKYQIQLKGAFEGQPGGAVERTTTTEIKNVGTTNVAVPAAARAKLGA